MCFSATASLTAAAVIGTVGVITVLKTSSKNQLFLASIPLLFSLQQISEGMVWLYSGTEHTTLLMLWKYFFLSFALFLWPVWIPLSIAAVEKSTWRQIVLGLIFIGGAFTALYNLYYIVLYGATVGITGHSIDYRFIELEQTPIRYLYVGVTILPWFFSSLKHMAYLGLIYAISIAITQFFFYETNVSVWCFFGALISVLIYYVIRDNPPEQAA